MKLPLQTSQRIRVAGLSLANKTGLLALAKNVTKSQTRILTYHRFGKAYITSELFEKQVKYLAKHFNIIDLGSYFEFLRGERSLPPYSTLLTVDDGYEDFYNVAFPVLKKYGIPATVFLTVDFIEKSIWLWHDLLNFGINNTPRVKFILNNEEFDLTSSLEKSRLKLCLDNICTSVGSVERDEFIDQILRELDVEAPSHPTQDYASLSWTQILEMSEFGISYGAHTCTHPILSRVPEDEAFREIRDSRQRIEEVIQNEIMAFCYPNGTVSDFDDHIENIVEECGFVCSMSMIYGLNDFTTDRYALRRMHANGKSFLHFIKDVTGFGALKSSLGRIKRETHLG